MMRWRALILLTAVALLAAGCGGPTGSDELPSGVVDGETIASPELVRKACQEGAVVYYTAQTGDNEENIVESFSEAFPCIEVTIVRAVTGQLFERISTEARAGDVRGDVTILTDQVLLERLVEQQLLRQWRPPSADRYPDDRKHEGYWYPGAASIMYFIYNNQLVDPASAPKTWADLLDPRWRNKIATAAPTIGGTGWSAWWFLRDKAGIPDYWQRMAAQNPRLYTSYSGVVTAVARGELPVGIECDLCDYPARTEQGAPLTPVYPPEGVVYVPYGTGILSDAPHPNAAELFANWYLSKQGQQRVVEVRGAYSARDDVAPGEGKPPLSSLNVYTPPLQEVVGQHGDLIAQFEGMFGNR